MGERETIASLFSNTYRTAQCQVCGSLVPAANLPEHLLADARILLLIKSTHPEWSRQECDLYLQAFTGTLRFAEAEEMAAVENCWEFMKCGREEGGARADELGVCPAYARKAGQACWIVVGTLCGGEIQGVYAQQKLSCMVCDFYNQFDPEHRSRMRNKFSA